MKKRLLSVLLTLSMVLTLLPGTALAATPDPDWSWTTRFNYQIDRADFARMLAAEGIEYRR